MRTYPTKAALLASSKAVVQRLANHPALSFVEQLRVLDLPKMNYGQAIFCAGWLQLLTERRPDVLRRVVARTEGRKDHQLIYTPACKLAAVAWYICPAGDTQEGRGLRRVLLSYTTEYPSPPAGWELVLNVWQN